jgi:hypothetical protein
MPVKRINFDVKSFIVEFNLSSFSIAQLNNIYIKREGCAHSNPNTSKQYLYRKVIGLVKSGFLKCVKKPGTKSLIYQLSEQKTSSIIESDMTDDVTLSNEKICYALREKLKGSKLSMLTSLGETEAYKECVDEMPILLEQVQARYNSSRDNTSRLLGKVNAYESLIELFEPNYIND